ncbi:hypothetical protein G7046_g7087 [Stylonectria norvegica]|nr:hypothetical protein G7046_g7087 [Stylonectria norvegica]
MSRSETLTSTKSTTRDLPDVGEKKPVEESRNDAGEQPQNKPDEPKQTAAALKTTLLLVSVFLSMFLVAVDKTIISTAIPRITDEFDSLSDVGWYGSVYLLTCCAFQLQFGKLYTFYSVKTTLLTSILIFEVASALCGAAPNSVAFIIGRAIAGVGAAGIMAGTIVSVVHTVPLNKRPAIQGAMAAVMGIATVAGPLIGGALTSNVTWRWCFYINLPFGGVAMAAIFLYLDVPSKETAKLPWTQKLSQLDAPGTACLVPGMISLLLALQWGGQTYGWNSARIIALLTLAGILLSVFVAAQILLPKTATIPPRIVKQRSVSAALWATLCIGASQCIFLYYLPIWFQSVKGTTAVQSGIHMLPMMIAIVVASILGGILNQKVGYYTPFGIAGGCMMAVGAGLLTTLKIDSSEGKWIGYQALYGLGQGLCFMTPNLATQTVLPKPDVPMGMALMLLGSLLGAAVFISVGENVLANQLLNRLSGIPGFDKSLVTSGGAISLLDSVPAELRHTVLVAYNEALRKVFQVGLIVACLAVLGLATMEWRSVLKKPQVDVGAEKGGATGEKKVEQTLSACHRQILQRSPNTATAKAAAKAAAIKTIAACVTTAAAAEAEAKATATATAVIKLLINSPINTPVKPLASSKHYKKLNSTAARRTAAKAKCDAI